MREDTYWITYVNKTTDCTGYLIYPYCPPGYCKPSSSKVPLNLNIPKGADAQCVEHRTGLLCGRCQHDFSLSIGSSRCVYCSPSWAVHFTAVVLVSFLAGIALVALILVLNLTVAVGTINSIIFYVNVVNAYSTTFFPFPNPTFATVFVSWLNLEPGFDLCFIKNLDAYWIYPYCPPGYCKPSSSKVPLNLKVYKKWPIEILEIICYMNLSLLCLATFFSKDIETKGTAINISVSITFVLLLGVLVYHTSTAIIPSCKRCTSIRPEIENQRNTCEESSLATQPCTSTVIDGPKNKAKEYNCELRESLLTS